MLEIGVQSGGSTRVWKKYFGPLLKYVGLDINPNCKKYEKVDEGIQIVTGSQTDLDLLKTICEKHGPFDFVVDDGGHGTNHIMASLSVMWGCLVSFGSDVHMSCFAVYLIHPCIVPKQSLPLFLQNDGAVYAIEDLHTHNMPASLLPPSHRMTSNEHGGEETLVVDKIKHHYAKHTDVFGHLAQWARVRSPYPGNFPDEHHPAYHLAKMVTYDSLVFLHYAKNSIKLERFSVGQFITY